MEKKIILVVREGLVVRNMDSTFTTFNGVGSVSATLEALKQTLLTISKDSEGLAESFATIYVPDVLNGLLSNSIGLYLRTGKTSSGKVIESAELNLYVEVFNMLKERSLNVRIYNLKFVSKDDTVTKALIKNAWAALDREERKILQAGRAGIVNAGVQQQQPSQDMNAMMAQMQQMQQMMMMMMQGGMQNMMGNMPVMPNMQTPAPVQQPTAEELNTAGTPESFTVNMSTETVPAPAPEDIVEEYQPEF